MQKNTPTSQHMFHFSASEVGMVTMYGLSSHAEESDYVCHVLFGVQATFAVPEASEVILPTMEGFHPSPVGEPDFHLNGNGWGGEPDCVGLAE